MRARYQVGVLPQFERDVRDLKKRLPKVYASVVQAIDLLQRDPYNREHTANIRKLEDVPVGDGQYRLRVGDYRLRYDVVDDRVILYSFRLRRESYR